MPSDLRDLAGFGPNSADSNQLAEAFGFLAWTCDPRDGVQANTDSTGSIHGTAVWLPAGVIVSKIANHVTVVGAGMTHSFTGLYDQNFNLLATSADSPSLYNSTVGWVELPMVTPYKTTYNGVYYAVDLNATGTTNPTMLNSGSFAAGINRAQLPNGTWRYFNAAGSPFTSLPATLTPNTSGLSRVFTIR